MKRISAVVISAVLCFMLCISTNSILNIDRIHVNNNEMDKSENVVNDDPIEIEKGDRLFILGWAFNEAAGLKKIVYLINGGEDVECEDNYKDRPDVAAAFGADASLGNHAGFGTNDTEDGKPGMFALPGIESLEPGTYKLRIKAVYENGSIDTKDYNLAVSGSGYDPSAAEKSEDQWLCGADPGTAMQPGFWFNPVGEPDDRYVTFTFTANGWFDGVKGFYYCSNPTADPGLAFAHMNVELIRDGSVVALAELSAFGDFWSTVNFGKSFGPGVYSLRYSCKSGSGVANNCWCVIGFCGGYGDCTYDANVPTPGEGSYPVLLLTGSYPAETQKTEPGDCNGDGAIDNKDVVVLFRYVSGTERLDDETAFDFNNDKTVDNKDVVALFRYVSAR